MIKDVEKLSLVVPEVSECYNSRSRLWIPKPWRKSVKDIIANPDVTPDDSDFNRALQLGTISLENGLDEYWRSNTFQKIMKFSENLQPWPWTKTTMYITGSVASETIFFSTCDPQINTIYPWQVELVGAGHNNCGDIDIYVSPEIAQFIKKNLVYRETKSRTVKNLALLEVLEKTKNMTLRFQFHFIDRSSLSPIAQSVLLAPTGLHAVGIAVNGPELTAIDPFGIFEQSNDGEFIYHIENQPPPMYLIDPNNPLSHNLTRVLDGFMIYALMTPYLNIKYSQEYTEIRKWIKNKLPQLTSLDEKILLEKYCKYANRIPYMDAIDTIDETPIRLATLGLMPELLNIANRHNHQKALHLLIFEMAWFARLINHPDAPEDIDENKIFDTNEEKDKILKLAREINWDRII